MIKLSACIEMLFGETDFYSRFEAAKKAGLNAVEFWGWDNKDIPKIKEKADENGLNIAAFCISAKNNALAAEYNKKRLLDRSGIDAFKAAIKETIPIAKELNVKTLIATTGQERNDITRYEQHTNVVLALKAGAPILEDAGVTLVLEPLNILADHRGYFLDSSYEAFEIAEEVDSPNVKILYDIYHQQISEGNIIPTITKFNHLIGHFHLADVPGRHQPGTGELNYPNIFKAISKTSYDRYVGMEYSPIDAATADTVIATLNMTK
jgi:hydroxypyruvate isomerase